MPPHHCGTYAGGRAKGPTGQREPWAEAQSGNMFFQDASQDTPCFGFYIDFKFYFNDAVNLLFSYIKNSSFNESVLSPWEPFNQYPGDLTFSNMTNSLTRFKLASNDPIGIAGYCSYLFPFVYKSAFW